MPIKQEVADKFTGHWQIGLFESPIKAPLSFCYGFCCPCCMTCQQRWEILDLIGEPYVCCGGLFPCGPLGEPQDKNCVFLEVCCCPGIAISANRFLIQTRFDRENTCCDDCLIWAVCLASWAVCILQCVGVDVPEEIENLVDCAVATVQGCMLAQQQKELQYVKSTGYGGPNPAIMGTMSPYQQQMMQQAQPPKQQHMGLGGAAVIGAAVGGGVGATAMMGMAGGGKAQQPGGAPPQMGYAAQGMPPQGMPPQVIGGGGTAGFLSTLAPTGQPWGTYCSMQQPLLDNTGYLSGPWGECLAWSKVFEHQNPGWEQMPAYRDDGPAGQVIQAMLNNVPGHMRQQVEQAAERLENACETACSAGQPLPIINQRA